MDAKDKLDVAVCSFCIIRFYMRQYQRGIEGEETGFFLVNKPDRFRECKGQHLFGQQLNIPVHSLEMSWLRLLKKNFNEKVKIHLISLLNLTETPRGGL